MKVTILDTETGKRYPGVDGGPDGWWWAEGNGSCDCNRSIFVGHRTAEAGYCLGQKRYLIVEAEDPSFTLLEYNDGYPPELLAKHGIAKGQPAPDGVLVPENSIASMRLIIEEAAAVLKGHAERMHEMAAPDDWKSKTAAAMTMDHVKKLAWVHSMLTPPK